MRRHAVRHDFGQTRANPQCVLRNASEREQSASATVPGYCTSRRVEHGVEVSRFRAIIVLSLEFCVSLGVVSGESAAVCFRNKLFFRIKLTFFVFWHLLRSLSRLLRSSVSQRLISSLQVGSAAGVSAS